MLLLGLTLDGFFADVVMVEFQERTITESIWRHVVVFDVVRIEAAADGTRRLIAAGRKPLAIGLHLGACVHCRERGRNPPGFQSVGCVSAIADLHHAEFFARFYDGSADFFAFFIGSPDFQTW